MSGYRVLPKLVVWDVKVQMREHVYLFTALSTLAFATVLLLLPEHAPDTVVTAILFLDPAVIGMGFVGGIILMERSQNTLSALAVSPATPFDYLASKIVTLTFLTFVGGIALVCVAYWPLKPDRAVRFIIAMGFTGALATVGGVALVATANSMNHLIARAFPVTVVLYLSFLPHFKLVDGILAWVLFGINPGHAMLRALLWAADPASVTTTEAVYAFAYIGVLTAILLVWTLQLFKDNIARSAT
jgi:fluoroquinolone transport system permease protein